MSDEHDKMYTSHDDMDYLENDTPERQELLNRLNEAATRVLAEARSKDDWVEVKAPKTWRPAAGATLEGEYMGLITRIGRFGGYQMVAIRQANLEIRLVNGVQALSAFEGSVSIGDMVKIEFLGWKQLDLDRKMREYKIWKRRITV